MSHAEVRSQSEAGSQRRGSRREDARLPAEPAKEASTSFVQRLLTFETNIGMQHEAVGILAGIILAISLLARRLTTIPRRRG